MAANPNRIKSQAAAFVPVNRHQVDAAIAQIGELQRQRAAIETRLNERLAKLKQAAEHDAQPIGAAIASLSEGVQLWCETHRDELLKGNAKTAKLGNGEVSWRARPPSVSVRAAELVIAALKKLGLTRFIRTKEEVDKSAILKEPAAVEGIKGISINVGGEDFIIRPFATELEEVA